MISILCPTRARPELYYRSVQSLLEHAKYPGNVEVLFRTDADDGSDYREMPGQQVIGEPLGYAGQHTYNNELADAASGDWLMIWNDDALMTTPGWDEIIESHKEFALLSLDNNQPREYACFPVVPRRWFELCGHLSLDCRVDSWLNAVAYDAGCFVPEHRVFITHDRHDLTGNNDDEVYQNRYIDPGFFTSFDAPQNLDARTCDAALIRGAM